jgi:hypothetical protein
VALAHGLPDHCMLADDGMDLFMDTSVVFANDRQCESVWPKANTLKR